jgi:hypothetical protein
MRVAALLGGTATTEGSASLPPSPSVIVARYGRALGGEAAQRRHTSATMRGAIETQSGKQLAFVYYASTPYLRLERVSLPDNKGDALSGLMDRLRGASIRVAARRSPPATNANQQSATRTSTIHWTN